jgi:multisubunit Na+/H+ antiporter MnhC subunit
MANIYAPIMRALVVVALVLATATLMFVAVNTARAANSPQSAVSPTN